MRNHLLLKTEHGRIALRQGRVMVRRSVVLAFVLVVSGAVPALAADKFQHEGWSGRAVFQDGKFRQCHMWMAAINNWDLGLALDPFRRRVETGGPLAGARSVLADAFQPEDRLTYSGRPRPRADEGIHIADAPSAVDVAKEHRLGTTARERKVVQGQYRPDEGVSPNRHQGSDGQAARVRRQASYRLRCGPLASSGAVD